MKALISNFRQQVIDLLIGRNKENQDPLEWTRLRVIFFINSILVVCSIYALCMNREKWYLSLGLLLLSLVMVKVVLKNLPLSVHLFTILLLCFNYRFGDQSQTFQSIVATITIPSVVLLVSNSWLPPIITFIFCSLRLMCLVNQLNRQVIPATDEARTMMSQAFAGCFVILVVNTSVASIFNQICCVTTFKLRRTLKELEERNQRLTQAIEIQDEFLLNVSHELNNPLHVLTNNLEALSAEKLQNGLDEKIRDSWIASQRLRAQVNNILDATKLYAGRLDIVPQFTSLRTMMSIIVNANLKRMVGRNGLVEGLVLLGKNLPGEVFVDGQRLVQIVVNLLQNAVKFTQRGTVAVSFQWIPRMKPEQSALTDEVLQPPPALDFLRNLPESLQSFTDLLNIKSETITNSTESFIPEETHNRPPIHGGRAYLTPSGRIIPEKCPEEKIFTVDDGEDDMLASWSPSSDASIEGYLKVSVVDTGCGVPEKVMQDIYCPFSKGDNSSTRRNSGQGLGLYIAKNLLLTMGGDIRAISQEHKGTIFTIVVPTRTRTQRRSTEREKSAMLRPRSGTQKMRALVVDDIDFNQRMLKRQLDGLEVVSTVADNGLEAFNLIKSKGQGYYNIVFMDLQMPIMDGKASCRMIRTYEQEMKFDPVKIIIVSGNSTPAEINECISEDGEIKAIAFLRKPTSIQEIAAAIC